MGKEFETLLLWNCYYKKIYSFINRQDTSKPPDFTQLVIKCHTHEELILDMTRQLSINTVKVSNTPTTSDVISTSSARLTTV